MKNKVISGIILIILITSLSLNLYDVQAFNGEIDTENYIILPDTISIQNGIGTGTIGLSSQATGYTIAYQKVDTTKDTLNKVQTKSKEVNTYIESANETIKEKQENVNTLQTEYENLQKDDPENTQALQEAMNKYEKAVEDYNTYYKTTNSEIEKLQNEYFSLIPNYTNSWKETTNSSNNINLDFQNSTGTICFVIWVKITNGNNTYYNFKFYTTEIKEQINTPSGDGETQGEWTDFSNAKFQLKKDGYSRATIEISNVKLKEDSNYYLFITNNNSKLDTTSVTSEDRINIVYNNDTNKFTTLETDKVAGYVELNQDLYINILEQNKKGEENVIIYGKKIERFAEPKYSDAFFATFVSSDNTQIVTNFTHERTNNRKMQIKIGKITDQSILQKIKNQDSSGFANLLNYAKSNSGIYDQIVDSNQDSSEIEYSTSTNKEKELINLKGLGLEDNCYYYLYVKTDNENGKYADNEAVTLAQSTINKGDGYWSLFFYGSSDFQWADFSNISTNNSEDNTTAKGRLPDAGAKFIIFSSIIIVTMAIGVIAYKKYNNYNF